MLPFGAGLLLFSFTWDVRSFLGWRPTPRALRARAMFGEDGHTEIYATIRNGRVDNPLVRIM